eukprot:765357-Hanusia_phi.AAC.1
MPAPPPLVRLVLLPCSSFTLPPLPLSFFVPFPSLSSSQNIVCAFLALALALARALTLVLHLFSSLFLSFFSSSAPAVTTLQGNQSGRHAQALLPPANEDLGQVGSWRGKRDV